MISRDDLIKFIDNVYRFNESPGNRKRLEKDGEISPSGMMADMAKAHAEHMANLEASTRSATKIKKKKEEKPGIQSETAIDLSLMNINPSADVIVERINAIMNKEKNRPKCITGLFYGAPGTGKSTLAKEVCKRLKKKPMLRSYADIQSMYVGQGESNLKDAFEEARRRDEVLILDECDSLMINRETASKGWEKSMTNQFLTELDKHEGIFFATTNFLDGLDAACLRRLFIKMEFEWLNNAQKLRAFNLFFNRRKRKLPGLDAIDFLAPGDFKAIQQRALYEPEEPSDERLLELLRDEVDIKAETMDVVRKARKGSIGF